MNCGELKMNCGYYITFSVFKTHISNILRSKHKVLRRMTESENFIETNCVFSRLSERLGRIKKYPPRVEIECSVSWRLAALAQIKNLLRSQFASASVFLPLRRGPLQSETLLWPVRDDLQHRSHLGLEYTPVTIMCFFGQCFDLRKERVLLIRDLKVS